MESSAVPERESGPESESGAAPSKEWPDITGYWPDAPHRAGPPADHYETEDAEAARTAPAWQARGSQRPTLELRITPRTPRRTGWRSVAAWKPVTALAAAVLVAGVMAWYAGRPPSLVAGPMITAPPTGPQAAPPDAPPVSIEASPSADDPALPGAPPGAATFELADGTTTLGVRIGETEGGWFQVSSPAGSGVTPRAVLEGGTVRLFVDGAGRTGNGKIDVVLSRDVTWSVLMRGGVRTASIDLTGGRAGRVDLLGGAAELDLALPRQDTVVPISMTGGIRDWRISTGGRGPVTAVLQRGAGAVVLYGSRDKDVDKGTRFTVAGGTGGIDLIADEGVGTLTVAAGQDGAELLE
ncbi:hypothetical protein QLQ12_01005 [Actinoplanes sp. NEAU-A12]|uniref:Adhesin domain-containing protein n=1 Tax=Actinoplanes sandaracinus TaxID=3045177 RepID=A0ABT6WBX4_9ACTN|nr:hypothetical protein [Actinoplanes sandaracinus]MDI6097187.1 hypothetical protein [Actinoplanes sandaracinus]